ncbi:MAG: gamma-glutamylcyclotransferase [Pirellulales bacterium]|nr:gamma-glutamylcyclotransferase [Pirellulales bacterium]
MALTQPTVIIFVYGTLKRGFPAHTQLRGSTFLETARTTSQFTLYNCGAWPAMVAEGHGSVNGELFEIPIETLELLDEYEGHPHLFRRTTITLAEHHAEAWLFDRDIPSEWPVITEGSWPGPRTP